MKAHHARGAKETVFDMPAVVSSGWASRSPTTGLRTAGVPEGAAAKNTSELAAAESELRHRLSNRRTRGTESAGARAAACARAAESTSVVTRERPVRAARC